MVEYVLSEGEKDATADLADGLLARHPAWDAVERADAVRVEAERLPLGLRQFLVAARAAEDAVITVSNLPVDADLVPTPASWRVAEKENAALREEVVLLLVASVLGDPFSWSGQQDGRLVHDVCPSQGQETSLTSASSRAELTLHTEDVFHSCRGDYVVLMCLRNPDGVGTSIAGVETADLAEPVREVLRQDRFRFYADDSHLPDAYGTGAEEGERPYEEASVLFGPGEAPYLRIDADFTSALPGDTEAQRALEQCARGLSSATRRLVLRPGTVAFLDNYRVVHGRDVFTPRYDGTDRWLKRTSVLRDLRRAYVHTRTRSRVLAA
ncbi:TauD/TfdA family dioxygenase [Streptomyces sp. NPDC052225]|uniref:TauD/TfdA family dioxygenase n=1 Tax=Streptomyces sp. NPDC052225 TaxID=3154949 RepID=UPI0034313312